MIRSHYVVGLLLREKRLLARFAVTTIGRTILLMAAILLIRAFLGGALGQPHGVSGAFSAMLGPRGGLWVVAGLLLTAFLGAAALGYDNTIVQQRIIRSIEIGVMERLIRHLLRLSVAFFDRQSHGDVIEAVREDVGRLRLVVIAAAEMSLQGVTAIGLLATATWMSPDLALMSLAVFGIAAAPVLATAKRIRKRSVGLRRKGYVLFDTILQMLRGIRIIKIYQGEEGEAREAVRRTRVYFEELIRITRITALGQVALDSLGGLSLVIITILGGFQVMDGRLTWPALLAFIMAVRTAHGPLYQLNAQYLQIQRYGASLKRIEELLAEQPGVTDPPQPLPLAHVEGVSFDRVAFSYDGSATVLCEVSFDLAAGDVLGIVGPSGSGKTTLLNLVARFYDPSSGQVRVNGRDVRAYRLADLHRLIAIVTQEPFLFATTVRENIRCGRPDSSDGEVEQAARAAEIHDDIVRLPQGYDTVVGMAGRMLSGGQVQRVNVARAILKNAPILILDEATSSLDSIAEARVQRALTTLMRGRTTFVVAHRLSTLRNASRILVLDRGRVMGLDRHDDLLLRCTLYRQLWEAQALRPSTHEPRPHSEDSEKRA
jgi:ABC-type multidrug transport system fused ATPase/permease subunit